MSEEHQGGFLRRMLDAASATNASVYATARKSLPIAYVLEKNGFDVEKFGQGLRSYCPFHEADKEGHTPSLSVFGDDFEQFNCWSCNARGDVTDLLQHFEPELCPEGKVTAALFNRVRELITECIDAGWTGPTKPGSRAKFDIIRGEELIKVSQHEPSIQRIEEFLHFKREQRGRKAWPYDASYLVEEWGVGTLNTWLMIPFYDTAGEFYAYKRWTDPQGPRKAAGGSSFVGHLYGEHREDTGQDIALIEGESDSWYAYYHLRDEYRVLAVPTGAGTTTAAAESMAGRRVFLAFDGDAAGRAATKRWTAALQAVGATVLILPIPEGKDLSTAGDIRQLLRQARTLVQAVDGIKIGTDGYFDPKKKEKLSNWYFEPLRVLQGEFETSYEGLLQPGGEKVTLRASQIDSVPRLKEWARSHNRMWGGSDKHGSALLSLIQSEEAFLPVARLVNIAGLHDNSYVWGSGSIGADSLVYEPPPNDAGIAKKINIAKRPWTTDVVHLLRDSQDRTVTDPFLAWLAACPFRPDFREFPFVGITGTAGAGKSQTLKAFLEAFSGSSIETSCASSAHSIETMATAVNAFPAAIVEFRHTQDSDPKSLAKVREILRLSWTEQEIHKGGMRKESYAALTSTAPHAPLIIEGEDELTEGSHVHRIVPLPLSSKGQNAEAFEAVLAIISQNEKQGGNGFAYEYYRNAHLLLEGGFKVDSIKPFEHPELVKRNRVTLAVLHLGWKVLQDFMRKHGSDLDEPNFDGIIETWLSLKKTTPIDEAIRFAIAQKYDTSRFVIKKDGEVWIEPTSFISYFNHFSRQSLFLFPSRTPSSIARYMVDELDGRHETKDNVNFVVIPLSALSS